MLALSRWGVLFALVAAFALLATVGARAEEPAATEVRVGTLPGDASGTATSNAAAQVRAVELPSLAAMSFRVIDRLPAQPAWGPQPPQIARQGSIDQFYSSGFTSFGSDENQTHADLIEPGSLATPMEQTPWGGLTQATEPRYELEVEGSVTTGSGNSTYSDSEYQEFELEQTLETRSGKEYTFYQEYGVEHSYTNSGELTLGAEQEFPDVLWNGDVELSEEFSQYKDRDDNANDYQQGRFEFEFDPNWQDGRWELDLEYDYRVKAYETFSTRSYKRSDGEISLRREFADSLEGEAYYKVSDYNYSFGSSRGNRRTSTGTEFEYEPNEDWEFKVAADLTEKQYEVTKDRGYEELAYEGSVEYRPDEVSRIEVEGEIADYDREFDPADSYEDSRVRFRYQRDITERLDIGVRAEQRRKRYDLAPGSDLDVDGWDASLNYNPTDDWNLYYDYDFTEYDYATITRIYERTGNRLGTRIGFGRLQLGAHWRESETAYFTEVGRDNTREDYDFDLDYEFDRSRLRVYYGVGSLSQADPASTNEYDETRYGAEWDFELDSRTELTLRYDFSERAYEQRDDVEDSRLEASLNFEL